MKKTFELPTKNNNLSVILLLSFVVILLQGCSVKPIFYHSEADIPYFHRSTKTTFKIVQGRYKFSFGVISAKDNDTLSYVLIAPPMKGESYSVRELTDVNLNYAIPLRIAQAEEFINLLNQTALRWNDKYDEDNGISYEFLVSPENKIVSQSDNVARWYPVFKYYFHSNDDGTLATMQFGEGTLQYRSILNRIEYIKELSSMVRSAIGGGGIQTERK